MAFKCESCSFRNPKGCATAIIMKGGKVLVLRRNEEPFKGQWDLPGGFMSEGELPSETVVREMEEELNVKILDATKIGDFPGLGCWKDEWFPVTSHAFLVQIEGEIKLNSENSAYQWIAPENLSDVAFDSNQKIVAWVKQNFAVEFNQVKNLVGQLDSSAEIREYNFYQAVLNGHVEKVYRQGTLVGMGWIFPRRTLLRKQAVIEDMICDESYRGQGIGKEIVLKLIEWAKKEGMEMVELTSGSHRIPANELYKKVGFVLHPTNHYLLKL